MWFKLTSNFFKEELDISDDKIWNIDKKGGEKVLWDKMFKDLL